MSISPAPMQDDRVNPESDGSAAKQPSQSELERRAAMLSVYYHSIGRRFEVRGAPAMLLPPEAQPMSLGEALDKLSGSERLMRQAIWTIARAVGPQRGVRDLLGEARLERYPPELIDVLTETEKRRMRSYDRRRGPYRRQAHLFGAALVAGAGEDAPRERVKTTVDLFSETAAGHGLDVATAKTGILGWGDTAEPAAPDAPEDQPQPRGRSALQFLREWQMQEGLEGASASVVRLEHEIGLSIPTFIEEFADSVAFAECFPTKAREVLTVFPTSSITVQDPATLTTRVTVTALVNTKNFHCLRIGMDPQCWSSCSSAFDAAGYLADPFGTHPPDPIPIVGGYDATGPMHRYLEEKVTVRLGDDASRVASFHNILNVEFDPNGDKRQIDVNFFLHRCIKSRVLWDERAGGILVDEGYARARPLGADLWRVTVRKTLRFSDRTPYAGGSGSDDFGQLLNYLTPAMLSWWIESEMYSAACPDVIERAKQRAAMESEQARAEAQAATTQQGEVQ